MKDQLLSLLFLLLKQWKNWCQVVTDELERQNLILGKSYTINQLFQATLQITAVSSCQVKHYHHQGGSYLLESIPGAEIWKENSFQLPQMIKKVSIIFRHPQSLSACSCGHFFKNCIPVSTWVSFKLFFLFIC